MLCVTISVCVECFQCLYSLFNAASGSRVSLKAQARSCACSRTRQCQWLPGAISGRAVYFPCPLRLLPLVSQYYCYNEKKGLITYKNWGREEGLDTGRRMNVVVLCPIPCHECENPYVKSQFLISTCNLPLILSR